MVIFNYSESIESSNSHILAPWRVYWITAILSSGLRPIAKWALILLSYHTHSSTATSI